jgi:predicted ABC-type ATPase
MDVEPAGLQRPRLGIVAGPNGSGKTSFYEQFLRPQFPRWVNADEIGRTLSDLAGSKRDLAAARAAEEHRERLLTERATFAFETVFSRTEHWVTFLHRAKDFGYLLQLFFVCTSDPVMNAARVKTRMERGGHAVSLDKVVTRYPSSIRTALEARRIVDELWLYDNTEWDSTPLLLGFWEKQHAKHIARYIPLWAEPFFR